MEHMRMDPKHQFAAQYMLSRAAAERRERDSILAAAVAGGSGLLSQIGQQNSRGASPAHSEVDFFKILLTVKKILILFYFLDFIM